MIKTETASALAASVARELGLPKTHVFAVITALDAIGWLTEPDGGEG